MSIQRVITIIVDHQGNARTDEYRPTGSTSGGDNEPLGQVLARLPTDYHTAAIEMLAQYINHGGSCCAEVVDDAVVLANLRGWGPE